MKKNLIFVLVFALGLAIGFAIPKPRPRFHKFQTERMERMNRSQRGFQRMNFQLDDVERHTIDSLRGILKNESTTQGDRKIIFGEIREIIQESRK